MKQLVARLSLLVLVAIAGAIVLSAAAPSTVLQPDKLIILSTTDVKGKTSPCG
jgi:hypothetical protein